MCDVAAQYGEQLYLPWKMAQFCVSNVIIFSWHVLPRKEGAGVEGVGGGDFYF